KLFVGLLQKMGMVVDAYTDPTTGKIEGEITPYTRFLVVGEPYSKDDLAGGKSPNAALFEEFNKNIATMKKEAADNGLFMISSYNFAFVIGYRPPGSADSTTISTFHSGLPTAGQGLLDKNLTPTGKDKDKKTPPPPPEKAPGK